MSRASSANCAGAEFGANRHWQRRKQSFACGCDIPGECRSARSGEAENGRSARTIVPTTPLGMKVTRTTNTNPRMNFQRSPMAGTCCSRSRKRKPDRRADGWADQRPGAADHRLDDELPRRIQREGVRRHIALEDTEQRAAAACENGGQHEHGELVSRYVVAERGGALRDFAGSPSTRSRPATARRSGQTRSRRK